MEGKVVIKLAPPELCTGCMACVQTCPDQSISVISDGQGHLYPQIKDQRCISCGKCQKVCPVLGRQAAVYPEKAFAVWSNKKEIRRASASGGAAAEFYLKALEEDFWICGAEYTDQFHVVHRLTKDKKYVLKFQQSKYVYSETNTIYAEVKDKLDNDEKVLFISLPCKIAGLLTYLHKTYKNLITVDIVCHGTPSHKILWEHVCYAQGDNNAVALKFREDNEFCFLLMGEETETIYKKIGRQDAYLAAFLEGIDYRSSCYECPFAKKERISDLTISDFWGLGRERPFEHPYTGAVSAVLVNSEKGRQFFESCQDRFFVEERPVTEAIRGNAQLNHPTLKHPKRIQYEEIYMEQGFEKAVRICLKKEVKADKRKLYKQSIRRNIRRFAGLFIKKYRG